MQTALAERKAIDAIAQSVSATGIIVPPIASR